MTTGSCLNLAHGTNWALYHADNILAMPGIPDNSVHLSVSSWPFGDQYAYTDSAHDFGNVSSNEEFFEQMRYLLPELLRVTIPGRWAMVHCKDRIVYGTKNDGYRYIDPFSDDAVRAMRAAGWLYYGRITVATDPVRENAQTNNLGYLELMKDSSRLGVGMPEYLLIFRKPHTKTPKGGTQSDEPVTACRVEEGYSLPRWQIDANSLWRSSGNRLLLPWEREGYDYRAHVRHLEGMDERRELGRANGEPVPVDHPAVWWDIQRTNVLNIKGAKENPEEKHICPLQLDLVERCIERASNKGDVVLDYFAGIGSVPERAIRLGRKGVGIELKKSYFETAVRYLSEAELQLAQPTLFDWLELQEAA